MRDEGDSMRDEGDSMRDEGDSMRDEGKITRPTCHADFDVTTRPDSW